jgi:hypothetical protein
MNDNVCMTSHLFPVQHPLWQRCGWYHLLVRNVTYPVMDTSSWSTTRFCFYTSQCGRTGTCSVVPLYSVILSDFFSHFWAKPHLCPSIIFWTPTYCCYGDKEQQLHIGEFGIQRVAISFCDIIPKRNHMWRLLYGIPILLLRWQTHCTEGTWLSLKRLLLLCQSSSLPHHTDKHPPSNAELSKVCGTFQS